VELLPQYYRNMHSHGNILLRIFQTLEKNVTTKKEWLVYMVDSNGFLVPIKLRIKPIIDKSGDLFILALAK
jgi:hypothetical protein